MESVYRYTSQTPPQSLSDYETFLSSVTKCLESSNRAVRRTISGLVAFVLASSQSSSFITNSSNKKKSTSTSKTGTGGGNGGGGAHEDVKILKVEEMLGLFTSALVSTAKSSSKEFKVGIVECYAALIQMLGIKFIETNYGVIVRSILELVTHPKLNSSRGDTLVMRECVAFLLREVLGKMLTESAQIMAVGELVNGWLKKWPSPQGEPIVNKEALVCVLNELGYLLLDLGPAASVVQETIQDPLINLLNYSSYSVSVALSWTFHCAATSLPLTLPKSMGKLIGLLQKEANTITAAGNDGYKRYLNYGNCLSAVISIVTVKTLYMNFHDVASAFSLAINLVKSGSSVSGKDLRPGGIQASVGWTILGSLMCLGPHFVKVHLAQILLLWKNAFPKPTKESAASQKTELDWWYAMVMKETALSALYSFLLQCGKDLVNLEVAKRLVVCLSNVLTWINTLPSSYPTQIIGPGDKPIKDSSLKLIHREQMIRRRIFQCFAEIDPPTVLEPFYSNILKMIMDHICPESTSGSNDKLDYGIMTSLVNGLQVSVASRVPGEDRGVARVIVCDKEVQTIEQLVRIPEEFIWHHYNRLTLYNHIVSPPFFFGLVQYHIFFKKIHFKFQLKYLID